jgi:hypothetical protein
MSFKKYANVNNVIIFIILLFIAFTYVSVGKEGFAPALFPKEVDFPLLYEDYPLKQNMGLSKTNSETSYKEYPIHSANSVESNNVRYWKTPDNGKCSPATFCDSLYDIKTPPVLGLNKPDPEWALDRVNYYLSSN